MAISPRQVDSSFNFSMIAFMLFQVFGDDTNCAESRNDDGGQQRHGLQPWVDLGRDNVEE